jgi:hypothetical protein
MLARRAPGQARQHQQADSYLASTHAVAYSSLRRRLRRFNEYATTSTTKTTSNTNVVLSISLSPDRATLT